MPRWRSKIIATIDLTEARAENWAQRLASRRALLSRRELDLIDAITTQPHEAAFLKQSELCRWAGVSKPVVISCFRRLGYQDYQTFQEGIQGFYAGQIDSAQASSAALKDVRSVAELMALAFEVEAATLETLRRHLEPSQVESLAQAILAAGTTYLLAEGTGSAPAQYLALRLRRLGLRAFLSGEDRPHVVDDLGPLQATDLFLTFFYTQEAPVVAGLLDLARSRGAVTAVITGAPDPELWGRSDHHLFVPRGRWNFKNSMAAPMAFAQILLLAVEFLGGAELNQRLQAVEAARKSFAFAVNKEES